MARTASWVLLLLLVQQAQTQQTQQTQQTHVECGSGRGCCEH